MDDQGQMQSVKYPKNSGYGVSSACSIIAIRRDAYQSHMTLNSFNNRPNKKAAYTYDQLIECHPCTTMRPKVDESLNIGYAKETVPRDMLGHI